MVAQPAVPECRDEVDSLVKSSGTQPQVRLLAGVGQTCIDGADADRQKEEILSLAYKQAENIKGQGDAESTRIYGQAFSKNPGLYKLLRTLESYKKVLDDKTTAILSSDSELLKVLMQGESAAK